MEANEWTPEHHDEDAPEFVVDNDSKADWALRKILEARNERDRMVAHFKRQIELAESACQRTEETMSALLMPYMDQVPAKRTKTQTTWQLPSGTIRIKQQAPEFRRDDAVLADWMLVNGFDRFVDRVPKPQWAKLKPLVDVVGGDVVLHDTGEIINGVCAVARPPKFEVEG